jgi:MFS family permease
MVQRGAGPEASGQLLALFLIVSVITRPFVGKLYDETKPLTLFTWALASFGFGTLLMLALGESTPILWVARAFQGIGFSIFNASSYSFLSLTIPEHIRGRGISVFSNFIKLAMAYAPGIGWVLGSHGYFREVFLCSLVFLVASYILLRQVPFHQFSPHLLHEAGEHMPEHNEETCHASIPVPIAAPAASTPPAKAKGKLFNAKGLPGGLLIASNSVVYGALIPFVPLVVQAKGITHVESFHLVYALALISSRFVGGEASDKVGRLFTILPGMAVVALSVGGMVMAQNTWQFLVAAAFYGLGSGVVQPSIVAMVADHSPPAERGSAMATYTMLADFGQASGMLLMGFMGSTVGYEAGLLLMGGLNLLGLGYGGWLRWRESRALAFY